jgi:hypothetical protein
MICIGIMKKSPAFFDFLKKIKNISVVLPCHNRHRYPPPAVAARPEAAQSGGVRSEAALSRGLRSEAALSRGGRPEAALSRGGRSEAALSGGGRPEAALRSACSPWRTAIPLRKVLFALLL